MTRTKNGGASRFGAWLAGFVAGMAMLLGMAWVYAYLAPFLPWWAAGMAALTAGVVATALFLGLVGSWLVPAMRVQTDSPHQGRLGLWVGGLFCLGLAVGMGMAWLHGGDADLSATGQTLVFFSTAAACILLLLCTLLLVVLVFLLFYSLFTNTRQCRLLAAFTGAGLLLYPLAIIGVVVISMQKEPAWEITKMAQAHNRQTYAVLRAHSWFSGPGAAALGRRKTDNPFFSTVQIVILEQGDGDPYGILQSGARHKDAAVREVCRELLKTVNSWAGG